MRKLVVMAEVGSELMEKSEKARKSEGSLGDARNLVSAHETRSSSMRLMES